MRPGNAKAAAIILSFVVLAILLVNFLHNIPTAPTAANTLPAQNPAHSHLELKAEILKLTNAYRLQAGLIPVKLGYNPAPQIHAQEALKGCYNSHWDRWDLRPNHRFALAGYTGFNLENIIGINHCVEQQDGYAPLKPLDQEITQAVRAWMNSPGHRQTILSPALTTLHLGIAHDSHNIRIVQHFEADYISYTLTPQISQDGILRMAGTTSAASLDPNGLPTLWIGYEPPPQPLTRGQLAKTYSLCIPTIIATILQPGHNNSSLQHITHPVSTPACADPTATDPSEPPPSNPEESNRLWSENKRAFAEMKPEESRAIHISARTFRLQGNRFQITTDLSELLKQHGPGIYSAILVGKPEHMNRRTTLSSYPVFWQTSPPTGSPYIDP